MMGRTMIIDLAHISARGFDRVYEMAEARDHYPLLVSHGHLSMMFPVAWCVVGGGDFWVGVREVVERARRLQ